MRISTGRVKLRESVNGLAFTVPKSVTPELKKLVGKEFECFVHENGEFQVIFEAVEKPKNFTIKIGGKEI